MKTTLLKGIKTVLKIGGVYCLSELIFAMGQGSGIATMLKYYEDDAMEQLNSIMPNDNKYTGIKAVRVAIIKDTAKREIKKSRC